MSLITFPMAIVWPCREKSVISSGQKKGPEDLLDHEE
jgi:hypothetical protein